MLDRLLRINDAPMWSSRDRLNQSVTTGALTVALLAYANGDAWLGMQRGGALSSRVNFRHLGMLALTLIWAGVERLTVAELGLGRAALGRSLRWGLLAGVLGAIPVRLFFAAPLMMNRAVTQPEFHGLSWPHMLVLLVGQFFLSTAVFEEIAFRSVLHAKLVRLMGIKRALLVGAGVFAAWHGVITWHNLRTSNLPRGLHPPLYAGAMLVLFVAGLLLGGLRQATGHVAGSILSHWVLVANVALAVARRTGASR